MVYQKPNMELVTIEAEDIITLSIGKDDYDPTINLDDNDPTKNPWQS